MESRDDLLSVLILETFITVGCVAMGIVVIVVILLVLVSSLMRRKHRQQHLGQEAWLIQLMQDL